MNEKLDGLDCDGGQGAKGIASKSATANARSFRSSDIFADAQEIIIEHEGDQYRLRRTSKGKLILTK